MASSHREAPLISNDPLADNTDVCAFRSPDNPNTVTLIACYVPLQLPQGGPNYNTFGENIRYEIHVNNTGGAADNIIYRFTFTKTNQDPSTFFNIRLGQQNLKTTYTLQKSTDGGATFSTVITNGVVPPPNIGPRSITTSVGLSSNYGTLFNNAITTASSGERVFCGTSDDPFFVDLGGIFDLGNAPRQGSTPKDGLRYKNVSTIAIQVNISSLQKAGKSVSQISSILDPDFVIGVWASASRQAVRTLGGGQASYSGSWVQVSRLGMPLTNEAVIPIGLKDKWNSMTPYQDLDSIAVFGPSFYQPELALYEDAHFYGGAIPALNNNLQIQRNSYTVLGNVGFGNDQQGLYPIKGNPATHGTAFDTAGPYANLLLPNNHSPRSVDIWPIFHTGVPNLSPYQLATGKTPGNPFSAGKPFINNFLPTGGDMLRLNMAVPPTQRTDPKFSSDGIIAAVVLGLTDTLYNRTTAIQFIPNMDGFPNGRRLEDDVTRIELQAVGGAALAAIGLWYDDDTSTAQSPLTPALLRMLSYSTGINANDTTLRATFPYVQTPWPGTGPAGGQAVAYTQPAILPFCNPMITLTANNTNLNAGGSIILNAVATNVGNNPIYTWYKNGVVISGATSHTLSFGGTLGNGDQVYTKVTTTTCGSPEMAISDTITFTKTGSSAKDIITFTMPNEVHAGHALINATTATIFDTVTLLPAQRTAIHPTHIVQSLNASYGPSAIVNRDFSMPVTYTVTAQDGSTKIWTVTVVDQAGMRTAGPNGIDALTTVAPMNLYPDPASTYITVTANGGADAPVITILDVEGRVMYNQQLPVTTQINHQIDLSDFASGMYFVHVAVGGRLETKPFIVRKD